MLTPARVHIARTSGQTDAYLARLWRVTPQAVREARTGATHRDHPTPPDVRSRIGGRRVRSNAARIVTPSTNVISQALRGWSR